MDYVKYHERRTLVWTIKVVVCGCLWLFVALSAWPWTAPVRYGQVRDSEVNLASRRTEWILPRIRGKATGRRPLRRRPHRRQEAPNKTAAKTLVGFWAAAPELPAGPPKWLWAYQLASKGLPVDPRATSAGPRGFRAFLAGSETLPADARATLAPS